MNTLLLLLKEWVFSYCEILTSIVIPDSVTSVGNSAFSDCSSLTSVVIPNGNAIIKNDVFNGCENLKSITIGDKVMDIK